MSSTRKSWPSGVRPPRGSPEASVELRRRVTDSEALLAPVGPFRGAELRRLEPVVLDRGQLLRPRLLARLAGRWDRRVTIVLGGPGFGKSTLLAQALRENLLATRGVDHWISITPADNDAAVLLRGIVEALALSIGAVDLAAPSAADEVAAAARSLPPGTCLVLDDLHDVNPQSSGHAALSAFVRQLPLQCSLLIGSRTVPSLPLSEWMAKGLVEIVDEDDLRYTPGEVAEVVKARQQADSGTGEVLRTDDGPTINGTADLGGWPALVELAAVTGLVGSETYLREAVLAKISVQDRERLAVLDAIGGGDAALLAAAMDHEVSGGDWEVIRRFPMMQRVGALGARPHALWNVILATVLNDEQRANARRRAAQALLENGRHDDALRLFSAEGNWDGVASVIADACKAGYWLASFDMLDRWRNVLPAGERWRPEAKLVDGIAERASNTFDARTLVLLNEAVLAFRSNGQVGAEVATLAELAFVAREQGDQQTVVGILARLFELESAGASEVVGMLRLGRAIVADALDEDEQLLIELAPLAPGELSRQWMSRAQWLRSHALMMLGRPEEALPVAERSRAIAEDDYIGVRFLLAYLGWWISVDAASIAALPDIGNEPERSPFDELYGGGTAAILHGFVGNVDLCRRNLDIAERAARRELAGSELRPEYAGVLAAANAVLAVSEGDDVRARAALSQFFGVYPADSRIGRRVARRWCGLVAVLLPDARDAVLAATYGPATHDARTLTFWFLQLRDGQAVPPPLEQPERRLLNALPMRWAVEAAARYASFDLEAARRICEHLVTARGPLVRTLLREIADSALVSNASTASSPSSPSKRGGVNAGDGARQLLGSVPVTPPEPLVIRLLGPLEIARGERVVDAPELRRERVRQIVTALVILGPTARESLTDLVWPDLDRAAASQNLRTTLNYVHRLLEPDRGPGDAPFVLRQHADVLSLAGSPWVETDTARFHSVCQEAEHLRRSGVHSGEVDALERALTLVRGEPFTDVVYEEWAAPFIRTLTAQISMVAQRAAELRFASGHHELAQANAATCLRNDPWCESAHNIMISSLLAQGRMSVARAALRSWRALHADFGVKHSPALEMLERRMGAS